MTTEEEKRPYTRVTPEIEAAVLHAREVLGAVSYTDIAALADVPERTVKYVLVDLPRLRRLHNGEDKAEKSLRSRILNAVTNLGQIRDVAELRRILGMADDEHNVMHVLHALHGAGKIDFTERGNGMGTATVINIRLPKKGNGKHSPSKTWTPADAQEPLPVISRQEEEQAISAQHNEVIEPEATAPQTSAPELDESAAYPLLTALLSRERDRTDADKKALAYIAAAEAVREFDPDAAADLMAKSLAYSVMFPSPLEQEYIRFAAANQLDPQRLAMAMDQTDEEDARLGVVNRGRKVDRILAAYADM